MRRIALVRTRDGQTEPYDPARIEASVQRALDACGVGDALLAAEIGSIVGLFLEKTFFDEIPTTRQVEEMLEKVLIETGHAAAARAYMRQRDRDERRREAGIARDDLRAPTLFGPATLEVEDPLHGVVRGFARERIARWVASEADLDGEVADSVATAVEYRLREHQVARPTMAHIQSLVEAELLERDLVLDPRTRGGIRLAHGDVAVALGDASSCGVADGVGRRVLRAHSLGEMLPGRAARAHLEGELHVHGLERPLSVVATELDAAQALASLPGGSASAYEPCGLRATRRAVLRLGRSIRSLQRDGCDSVALSMVGAALAPAVAGLADDELEEVAWDLVHAFSRLPGEPRAQLDLTPGCPVSTAYVPLRGLDGEPVTMNGADGASVVTALSAATARVLRTDRELPELHERPHVLVAVAAGNVADPDSRAALWSWIEYALDGGDVTFRLERGDVPERGPVEAASTAGSGSRGCFGRVTLNLPRLAARAGRDSVEGFLRLLDEAVPPAVQALQARREWLVDRPDRLPAPVGEFHGSVAVTGLNEAIAVLRGTELHELDASGDREARRIVGYLGVLVRRQALEIDLPLTLDADPCASVATRLRSIDRSASLRVLDDWLPKGDAYSPGVSLRAEAPVDLLVQLERQEGLHSGLTTATLDLRRRRADWGGPESVLAVLDRLRREGGVRQVRVHSW